MPDPARKTLSATETPVLFGVSPYSTRWMLLRRFIHGDEFANPEHNRMNWGTRMQPLLLQQAADDLHLKVTPNATDTYRRRGLLGCTRDAEVFCPDRGRHQQRSGAIQVGRDRRVGLWRHEILRAPADP